MQTIEEVKRHCRMVGEGIAVAFVAEVDKSKLALRETVATLDQLYRAKLQEYFG